jgi:hypothetical protein
MMELQPGKGMNEQPGADLCGMPVHTAGNTSRMAQKRARTAKTGGYWGEVALFGVSASKQAQAGSQGRF